MVQPFLFVGVGGSGGKTLRAIKQELKNILRSKDWEFDRFGFPVMWQFVHFDTPYQQDGEDFPARPLDSSEYLGLVEMGAPLDSFIANLAGAGFDRSVLEEIMAPLPKEGHYDKPVDEGAGQYRGIGREVAIARLEPIKNKIRVAFANMQGPEKSQQRTELERLFKTANSTSGEVKPKIILISSLAGGSGSGQFLDVSEAIKAAAPNEAWIHDQTAILFAPDVFDDPKITQNEGIAPNSLFATGELVSGKWRRKNSEIQELLYQKFKFAKVGSAEYNVGPKRVVLVGRSNGQVEFPSQNSVYMASALSLAKWATDADVAEALGAYLSTNDQGEAKEPAKLKVSGLLNYPITSIGFARVSLGMDYFADYAAGRLARQAVDNFVFAHNRDKAETDTSAIDSKVALLIQDFGKKLKLTDAQIKEALTPPAKRAAWSAEFSKQMSRQVGDLDQQRSATDWIDRIVNGFKAALPGASASWTGARETETWVFASQRHVNGVVASFAATHGLLVAEGLLRKYIQVRSSQISKQISRPDLNAAATEAKFSLTERLKNRNAGTMRGSDPDFTESYSEGIRRAVEFMDVEDNDFVTKLVADMLANYLTPLADELHARYEQLVDLVDDPDYKGRGINMFRSWPTEDVTPPAPAPNVRLLIPHTEFKDRFRTLLGKSTQEAVYEMVSGSKSIRELENFEPEEDGNKDKTWIAIKSKHNEWIPAVGTSRGQARWSGSFVFDLDDWEDIAEKYVRIKGRPLGELIATNLYDWLNDKNPSVQADNEARLKAEFSSVLSMSRPFAKVNRILYSLAHGGAGVQYETVFSDIPVNLAGSSRLGGELRDLVQNSGIQWNKKIEAAFKGESATSSTIDIFSTLKSPIHHFVFDNLMTPIIERWGEAKGSAEQRSHFMKFRQGRALPETIPLAPEVLEQALRGWYVGKLLNRIVTGKIVPGQSDSTKLSIHFDPTTHKNSPNDGVRGYKDFPYPLLFPRDRVPDSDHAAVALASISIALAECSDSNSLEPLMPYHELMYLGGNVSVDVSTADLYLEISDALRSWILDGALSHDAPLPNAAEAGTASSSIEERRNKAISFFEKSLAEVDKHVNLADPLKRHDTLVWQMRRETISALNTLIKFCVELTE